MSRCASLRWKMALLLTIMVLSTSVAMFYLLKRVSLERVLEHELVDLADETNGEIAKLRLELARAKESAITLASKLAGVDGEALAQEFQQVVSPAGQDLRENSETPVMHCLRAEIFVVADDAKQVRPLKAIPWTLDLQDRDRHSEFVANFASRNVVAAFSPPQRIRFIPTKMQEGSNRITEHLVVQLAARVPGSLPANGKSGGRFVVLTLELSGLDSFVPQPLSADHNQPILDQMRSSPIEPDLVNGKYRRFGTIGA